MATVAAIIDTLKRNTNNKYYVVDVSAAIKQLTEPREDLEQILRDPTVSDWHFYALEGLRSIVENESINASDFAVILNSTKNLALRFGIDEFYKSFDSLANQPSNSHFLANFVTDLLSSRDQSDWLWLAFSAMSTLLQRQEQIPSPQLQTLAAQLRNAYETGPETLRKPQMREILLQMRPY